MKTVIKVLLAILAVELLVVIGMIGYASSDAPFSYKETPIVTEEYANPADNIEYIAASNNESLFSCAAMLINAFDYDFSPLDFYNYVTFDSENFVLNYYGNVNSGGMMFPEGTVNMINTVLDNNHIENLQVNNIAGCFWEEVEEKYNSGKILMLWYTSDYNSPIFTDLTYDRYRYYSNSRCVVIKSIDDTFVTFYDAQNESKTVTIPKTYFKEVWTECGSLGIEMNRI